MKKSFGLFLLLSGLALLLLPVTVIVVGNGKKRIVITQEVLSGDPAAAAGVTLVTASQWDGHLFWNTAYSFGSEKGAKNEFDFSTEKVIWDWEREKRATLALSASADLLEKDNYSSGHPANFVFPKIAQQAMYRAVGETYSETVSIKDYYHTYPVAFRISGTSVNYGQYQDACNYFLQLFHIPVGEEQFQITIYQRSGSDNRLFEGEFVSNAQNIVITDASAFGREGFYYTYTLENPESGESVERGQDRGIYFFPYKSASEYSIEPDWKKAKNVCEFPQGMVPVQMRLDENEKFLYLVVREKQEYSLLVYCLEDGVMLQDQIPLNYGGASGNFYRMHFVEGGILFAWEENDFSFVAGEDGQYRWWCSGIFPQTPTKKDEINPFPKENACAFDGKRLVLAAFENWDSLSVQLVVHDENGQLYCGRYLNSQDTEMGFSPKNRISPQGLRIWTSNHTLSTTVSPIKLVIE